MDNPSSCTPETLLWTARERCCTTRNPSKSLTRHCTGQIGTFTYAGTNSEIADQGSTFTTSGYQHRLNTQICIQRADLRKNTDLRTHSRDLLMSASSAPTGSKLRNECRRPCTNAPLIAKEHQACWSQDSEDICMCTTRTTAGHTERNQNVLLANRRLHKIGVQRGFCGIRQVTISARVQGAFLPRHHGKSRSQHVAKGTSSA